MTPLERFKAVLRFEKPDYWPLVIWHAMGYPHKGGLAKMHREGLPESVNDHDSWAEYWGEMTIDHASSLEADVPSIKSQSRVEGEFEIIEYETGAVTKQVIDNDMTYSMPEFREFHVRDRESWESYRKFLTPRRKAVERIEELKRKYAGRTRPLAVHIGGTWGRVRNDMGPERALTALYDDPELVHDMIDYRLGIVEEYVFPVIEALRPEIVHGWEDNCYNHGILISPAAFREFCTPYYRKVADFAREHGAELLMVDSDGKVNEMIELLDGAGFNGLFPVEQVCGNDIVEYRGRLPNFVFAGGIEKEIASTGNVHRIEKELVPKVPAALEGSGYFPAFDHGLSTNVGFEEHCICMTRLHEICGSADLNLGEFPRKSL